MRDEDLDALAGLESTLVWLDLARTSISDAGIAALSRCRELRRLVLANTAVGDAALPHLTALPKLESLNLYGTRVTDAGLAHLAPLASLRRLYLWQTAVTDDGIAPLRAALPELRVDAGRDAERLAAVAKAVAPVNAECPLTGKPVDPAYTVRHGERVVGFCCGDCRAKFVAEPAKYAEKVGR